MRYSVILPVGSFGDAERSLVAVIAKALREHAGGEAFVVPCDAEAQAAVAAAVLPEGIAGVTVPAVGFAAAANEAARRATGEVLIFVRNARPVSSEFVPALLDACGDPQVGVAGGLIAAADGSVVERGLTLRAARLEVAGIALKAPETGRGVPAPAGSVACDAVSLACLATPRALFVELGGFDPAFSEVCDDADYCLRVRERGLRAVVEPRAWFVQTIVASSPRQARRARVVRRAFAERWRVRAVPRENADAERTGVIRREYWRRTDLGVRPIALPKVTVIVHGPAPASGEAFEAQLRRSRIPAEIVWAADPLAQACAATQRRGEGYVVFVRTDTRVEPDWLSDLVDTLEYAAETVAATVVPADEAPGEMMPWSVDGRCTIVAPRLIPPHLRLRSDLPLEDALGDWVARGVVCGRHVRRVRRPIAALGPPAADGGFAATWGLALDRYRQPDPARIPEPALLAEPAPVLASIVMLSWNAPEYTELAVASIRERTRAPYEIIIIDNGSEPATRERLAALTGVRIIYNAKNTGFAHGCSQGMAAARGTHVVLLNNDVIVTEGWLEAMLEVQRLNPAVGVSAPRSNRVSSSQQLENVPYRAVPEIAMFAAERSLRYRGLWYRDDKAVGFCLCIDRRVIAEVGAIDTRYGLGNYEDDDFCIRVRSAGYDIAVCEDAFIHHFGNVSFVTNKLEYAVSLERNRAMMLLRFGIAMLDRDHYNATPAIDRGFDRDRHFVPLPQAAAVGADWVGTGGS